LLVWLLIHWWPYENLEAFTLQNELENYPIGNSYVYENVHDLIVAQPSVRSASNVLIYLINWPYGFGSALSVHAQNAIYLRKMNSDLTVLPHFSQNSKHFKYHQQGYHNSFFLYFDLQIPLRKANEYKIYFAKSTPLESVDTLDTTVIPPIRKPSNAALIDLMRHNFRVRDCFRPQELHRSDIGIHIRGAAQKKAHHPDYLATSIDERLKRLANHVSATKVFVMSDVQAYINKAKEYFNDITFLSDIMRVANDSHDSIPELTNVGFKLGSDILRECYVMSECDQIYVSESNIPFIISLINPNVKMFGF